MVTVTPLELCVIDGAPGDEALDDELDKGGELGNAGRPLGADGDEPFEAIGPGAVVPPPPAAADGALN